MRTARCVVALVALFALSACSGAPAVAPSPSVTPREVATPRAAVIVRDDFSDPDSGWPVIDEGALRTSYAAGRYRVEVREPGIVLAPPSHRRARALEDVEVEVTVRFRTDDDLDNVGVVCRASVPQVFHPFDDVPRQEQHYSFSIFPNGDYRIRRQVGAEPVDLVLGHSDAIATGAGANRLRAACVGERLSLRVNGVEVASVDDDALTSGTIGLRVGSGDVEANGDARFDDFIALDPHAPRGSPAPTAEPSVEPSEEPSDEPTDRPTAEPSRPSEPSPPREPSEPEETTAPPEPSEASPTPVDESPSPVPSGSTAPPAAGRIVFVDDFSDPASGWLGGEAETSDAYSSASYVDGALVVQVDRVGSGRVVDSSAVRDADGAPLGELVDVSIELDAVVTRTPGQFDVGLQCRRDGGRFYYLGIRETGEAFIIRITGRGEGEVLAGERSRAVRTAVGARNRLRADCIGDELSLHVNGRTVVSAVDRAFERGAVAMEVGAGEDAPVEVSFDNLTLRDAGAGS